MVGNEALDSEKLVPPAQFEDEQAPFGAALRGQLSECGDLSPH
jgi:hypothetical protein